MNELKIVKEKIKSVKSKLKTDKKTFLLLVPAGIIVLIIAFTGGGNVVKNTDKNAKNTPENDGGYEIEYVENAVAQKIKSLVCEIDGAGNVNVSVSLESTGTIHYAQDVNEKKENDSIFKDSEYIYTEGNAGQPDGLIVRIDAPVIKGVAVVCDGGESAVIKNEIKSLISSLYNIGSDRIYVGK